MLALRLAPEIEARLAKLAKRTGRTKSFYAREAILRHLDELEDLYLAKSRFEDLRNGRSESIPLNDLIRRYGVED
jgi:RHH-type transcriptional regulator, rel operon repressor / antitoxin RelB